ncbi:MAG: hypothetical protein FWC28_00750 [Proteobacteria bacterium]|nr:hypothetical protein [Cystobacterineae bacterium]MCL2258795.1 hypothetical protein [Cystobacterineae bacterium]MCL2313771.1 hypothetical protein [Pseudomonadota bacterium]
MDRAPKIWSLGKAKTTPPPKPRGRFVQVSPSKENLRVLLQPKAKERLLPLLRASSSQEHLLAKLSEQFRGDGEKLTWQEVSSILGYHDLLLAFEEQERRVLHKGLLQHRCSLDKLSKLCNTSPDTLKKRIAKLGLQEDFAKLRKHYASQILDSQNVGQQLRVLAQPGYVRDLGIKSALQRQFSLKLKSLLDELPPEFETPESQLEALAKKYRLDKNLLLRVALPLKLFEPSSPP